MPVGRWFRDDPPQDPGTRPMPVVEGAVDSPPSRAGTPAPLEGSAGTPGAGSRAARALSRAWRPRVIGPVWQLVAALVVMAGVVGIVVGVVGRGDDGSGNGTGRGGEARIGAAGADPAREQATALDQLLSGSSHDRDAVVNAVVSLKNCRGLAAATATLRDAAANREALVAKLEAARMSQVPGGKQLKRTLRTAWQSSADADLAFAQWGTQTSAAGCPGGQPKKTAAYTQGATASATASRAKKSFVSQWNEVASRYGLERRQPNDI